MMSDCKGMNFTDIFKNWCQTDKKGVLKSEFSLRIFYHIIKLRMVLVVIRLVVLSILFLNGCQMKILSVNGLVIILHQNPWFTHLVVLIYRTGNIILRVAWPANLPTLSFRKSISAKYNPIKPLDYAVNQKLKGDIKRKNVTSKDQAIHEVALWMGNPDNQEQKYKSIQVNDYL